MLERVLGTVTLGAVGIVGVGAVAQSMGPEPVVVQRIVDGDTIEVLRDGEAVTVRLLNVDTPETKHPLRAVECLGPEATDFLAGQLPVGSEVVLRYDEDRVDRYGRDLAGVVKDDLLVNAEIARAGLGVPVVFAPNEQFYGEVAEAFEEARSQRRGVFDPAEECTFASRSERLTDRVAEVERIADADVQQAEAPAEAVVEEATALLALIDEVDPGTLGAAGMTAQQLSDQRGITQDLRARAHEVHASAVKARQDAEEKARTQAEVEAAERAETERQAAEKAEADRRAAEQAEVERQAAERAEAERLAEAERQESRQPVPAQPARPPAPAQPAPQPAEPGPRPGAGYTGCRAYVGGPYIDDQGRAYTPIDCETKVPLVP